jgi:protoporphyrinogen oxidase
MSMQTTSVAVIGAGPAGLTAAYLLGKRGTATTVLEADPVYVGGISRTAQYKGFLFDIGGHRFFSKSKQVEDLWTEILPDDLLLRPRTTRIFYNGKFFAYPLKGAEALFKLGPVEAAHCLLSYLRARAFPTRDPKNFQDWVVNQFGERLFQIFFKTYTEKVWGMGCKEISADWAAQRINKLSLGTAILNALLPKKGPAKKDGEIIKTLIESFRYPRRGPGMLWEECARKISARGGKIEMGRRVSRCSWDPARARWTVEHTGAAGEVQKLEAEHLISSAPMAELCKSLDPLPSAEAMSAAAGLRYRDFLTVVLILKDRNAFDDNWIYIHDPGVKVGRVQNFKSWSPEMVPDPALTCYGLEYFCFEGDGTWTMTDAELVELGKREMAQIGLAPANEVFDGCVVRQKKAYPVYDDGYAARVETVRRDLEERFPTLHLVGRNGMHKYNNQDHAMMTAMLTVENIAAGKRVFDTWRVNQDAEYHEAGAHGDRETVAGLREVPRRVA